jgi:hypothetical protein
VSQNRSRRSPVVEVLEERRALSATPTSTVTLSLLNGFTHAYLSHVGQPNYNPAFDLNHNGQIGQTDGRLLLRALPPVSPKVPLKLTLSLAPQDRARGPLPHNSGGITHSKEPTVLGHTTPGALVFSGTGTFDLNLHGPAVVADANGNFSYTINLTDGINQLNFQVVTPFGQQLLRAYPIYWLNFAQYEAAHPQNK